MKGNADPHSTLQTTAIKTAAAGMEKNWSNLDFCIAPP